MIDQAPPPTGLAVTFGCNSLTLTWTPSPDHDVVAYEVLRDGQFVGRTSVPRIVVTGLTGGSRYTFTVAALDAAGNLSMPSDPLSVTEPVCDPIRGRRSTCTSSSSTRPA